MPDDVFLPVSNAPDMFDVARGDHLIGLVWRRDNKWHADPLSMAAPLITESTREAAAAKLYSLD
jgi:hypothetical protein